MRRDHQPAALWVSLTRYGQLYDVHPKTARKWLEAGLLEWFRQGKVVRVKNQPPKNQPDPTPVIDYTSQ